MLPLRNPVKEMQGTAGQQSSGLILYRVEVEWSPFIQGGGGVVSVNRVEIKSFSQQVEVERDSVNRVEVERERESVNRVEVGRDIPFNRVEMESLS